MSKLILGEQNSWLPMNSMEIESTLSRYTSPNHVLKSGYSGHVTTVTTVYDRNISTTDTTGELRSRWRVQEVESQWGV